MAMEAARSRNLWQVPTFLLGITSLVAVGFGRSYWQPSPAERYERDLYALRQALDKNPVDTPAIQMLLRKVHGMEVPAHLVNQTSFVIGSALVISAESNPIPDEAIEQWKSARKLLEAAEKEVTEAEKPRQRYRLAKTWARTGEPALKVIDALNAGQTSGDDTSEGSRLLAEMYLKIDPPEPKKARDALKEYLGKALPARNETQLRQLNLARLSLGELQIQLGEPDDARKVLERIGPDASPDLLIAARTQLAKSFLAEEDWTAAIRCLEQAREVRGITPQQKTFVLYHLAEAYQRSNRKSEALAVLQQMRKSTGPEAQAAAFRLVEMLILDPQKRDEAVEILEAVSAELKSPAEYDNKLLPLAAARDVFEESAELLRTADAFDLSLRVARAYAKLATGGRDRELAANALQAYGQMLFDQAPIAEPEDRPRLAEEGTKRCREAAREWYEVAQLKKTSIEKGEPLYRSADLYLKAGDIEESLKMLDELGLKVPDFPPERLADVWLKKGEVYLALNNREQAKLCFQNGVQQAEQHPSPALLRCQIRLVELLLKGNDPKLLGRVIGELEQNLANPELNRDKDLHEAGLFLIADMHFQQKDYRKAEVKFRSLLDSYPDSPRALNARFQLGQCYWFVAGQEADKCKAAKKIVDDPVAPEDRKNEADAQYEASYKQYMEWLVKAAEPFKMVESALLKGMAAPKLSPEHAELLRKTSFYAADCAFFSGKYTECVERFDAIATRYSGSVAQLEALRTMWRCYQYYLQDGDKALDTLTHLRTAYVQLPDGEFDGSSEIRRRDYWQRWFDQVAPMKK